MAKGVKHHNCKPLSKFYIFFNKGLLWWFCSRGSDILSDKLMNLLIMVYLTLTCISAMVIIGTYFKDKLKFKMKDLIKDEMSIMIKKEDSEK